MEPGRLGSENGAEYVPYQISQRADFFETEMGLDTMVKRPIINTRDEPHANRDRYRRLHVIIGDANMSEFTTYLKVGTALVVLQMIEDGFCRSRWCYATLSGLCGTSPTIRRVRWQYR